MARGALLAFVLGHALDLIASAPLWLFTFASVAVWWLARGRHTLSVLALVAGALFKFVPLLLLPAAGLISLRALPDARARLIPACPGSTLSAGAVISIG